MEEETFKISTSKIKKIKLNIIKTSIVSFLKNLIFRIIPADTIL